MTLPELRLADLRATKDTLHLYTSILSANGGVITGESTAHADLSMQQRPVVTGRPPPSIVLSG